MSGPPPTGRPLRVGLNLLFLTGESGGVGRYARELPGALLAAEPETEVHLFVARDAPADLRSEPWAGRVRWTTLPLRAASLWLQGAQYLVLPMLSAALRLDVLHNPANAGPVITPGLASAVSVMDLIWLHRPAEWEPDPRAHRALRRVLAYAVRHADRVFAISQATADDLDRSFAVPAERITVTRLGVRLPDVAPAREEELRARLELGSSRVLLCVAQKRPYKNLGGVVRALAALDTGVVAVLVGPSFPYEAELRQLAVELGVEHRLRLVGWVSDAELAGLYSLSDGFVLPSLIEGFGLPVLEAMAYGVPVACSDIPALAEVAGEAAIMFDPGDQDAIDRSLALLLGDAQLRGELVARGRARAAELTWARTGEASLRGYREAIAGRAYARRR